MKMEFIFLTGLGGQLQVQTVDTGILATDYAGGIRASGIATLSNLHVHVPIPPTPANRFLGFAVRAYESDDSNATQSAGAIDSLVANIHSLIGPTVAGGRAPTVNQLWLAVNGGAGVPGDDRIGVSARLLRDLGREVTRDGVRRSIVPNGSQDNDEFLFRSSDTRWRMQFQLFHQSFG